MVIAKAVKKRPPRFCALFGRPSKSIQKGWQNNQNDSLLAYNDVTISATRIRKHF